MAYYKVSINKAQAAFLLALIHQFELDNQPDGSGNYYISPEGDEEDVAELNETSLEDLTENLIKLI